MKARHVTAGYSDILQPEEERVDGGKALNDDVNGERVRVIEQSREYVEGLCSDCMVHL